MVQNTIPEPLEKGGKWAIVNQMVHFYESETMDRLIGAIADPTRRAIVERLARGPSSIAEAASGFSMTLTGFCKHVRVLERAGLVSRVRDGREKFLALNTQPLMAVAQWVFGVEQLSKSRVDRLETNSAHDQGHD